MKQYMCFDVGGSFIKYGVLREDGQILFHDHTPTDSHRGVETLTSRLLLIVEETRGRMALDGIAVATTGIVDVWKGAILSGISGWIDGYEGLALKQFLEEKTGLPTEVENDVNCVALAESWLGSARGYRNVVCMAVGTGIGGALLINQELYRGTGNMAMEIGRMPIYPSTLEDLASVRALVYEYAKLCNLPTTEVNGLMVAQREREGDKNAVKVFDMMCHYLAEGIACVISALAPDVLVIGGAIATDSELIDARLKKELRRILDKVLFESINIQYAQLGNMAGMTGSLRHHMQMTALRQSEENND